MIPEPPPYQSIHVGAEKAMDLIINVPSQIVRASEFQKLWDELKHAEKLYHITASPINLQNVVGNFTRLARKIEEINSIFGREWQ